MLTSTSLKIITAYIIIDIAETRATITEQSVECFLLTETRPLYVVQAGPECWAHITRMPSGFHHHLFRLASEDKTSKVSLQPLHKAVPSQLKQLLQE